MSDKKPPTQPHSEDWTPPPPPIMAQWVRRYVAGEWEFAP